MLFSKQSHILPRSGETRLALTLLRCALAAGLLSAVADRFGFWGPPGAPRVAWGSFAAFLTYTSKLNPWCPTRLIPALGWSATVAEFIFGMALVTGFRIRLTGVAVAALTASFAAAMTFTLGIKVPLDYSVFSFAASAYVLACAYKDDPRTFAVSG